MKAIKGVVKAVKKVVKKVAKSKLGKALLIGATIYFGGAALGMWNAPGPLSGINGILKGGAGAGSGAGSGSVVAGGGTTGSVATTAGYANTTAGMTTSALPGTAATAGSTTAGAGAGAATGSQIASGVIPSVAGGTGQTLGAGTTTTAASSALPAGGGVTLGNISAEQAVANSEAGKGIISKMMSSKPVQAAGDVVSGVAKFADAHPAAAMIGLNAAAGAFSPDEIDIMREQQRIQQQADEDERQRRSQNLAGVGDLDMGQSVKPVPLRFLSTQQPIFQRGIINTQMGA